MIFHSLNTDIPLPKRFNNPFYYEPHPLCKLAVERAITMIEANKSWQDEIAQGKMFGVLIVQNAQGKLGFLAAYSGQIDGRSDWDDFVPAVFDYLQEGDYFKIHEQQISNINTSISTMEHSVELEEAISSLDKVKNKAQTALSDYKERMKEAKAKRDIIRMTDVNKEQESALIHESQYMKAELHRIKKHYAELIQKRKITLNAIENHINQLKDKRKHDSDELQKWLFSHFVMLNARGETKDVLQIFDDVNGNIPPAGSGECCAPKLLQYAYKHTMQPIIMAEFWWGRSPKTELRTHLHYYPSCSSKCKPILTHMLRGLDVEPNALEMQDNRTVDVIYEDDYLAVINKPTGMLSMPGKGNRVSVYDITKQLFRTAETVMVVHRLDMHTSGLLLIAKTLGVYKALQKQFATRKVHKRYIALLSSALTNVPTKGIISLPLRPDIDHRPRQMVDFAYGKEAITEYEILDISNGEIRIALYPKTGRTHQLRVHCAHPDGLNSPIKGDELYGTKQNRLYLHAESIEFEHPVTYNRVHIEQLAEF